MTSKTRPTIEDRLVALPSPDKSTFFPATREVAEGLKNDESDLRAIAADKSRQNDLRLKALYLILFYLRRQKDYISYRRMVDEYRKEFGGNPIFRTFEVVYERSLGEDERSMARAIRASRRTLVYFNDSPGVLHQFAELVVRDQEIHHNTRTEELQEAETAVERAIDLSPKSAPHYWNTLSRIQTSLGDFRSARRSIAEAMELESDDTLDSALRLNEHQLVETRIHFAEERQRAEKREQQAQSELNSIRSQMLEILGLLAAIIAFLTTSVSITSGKTFEEAARLLLVSASLIIVVFSVFAYAFKVSSLLRLILPLAAGIGTFLASLFYGR